MGPYSQIIEYMCWMIDLEKKKNENFKYDVYNSLFDCWAHFIVVSCMTLIETDASVYLPHDQMLVDVSSAATATATAKVSKQKHVSL